MAVGVGAVASVALFAACTSRPAYLFPGDAVGGAGGQSAADSPIRILPGASRDAGTDTSGSGRETTGSGRETTAAVTTGVTGGGEETTSVASVAASSGSGCTDGNCGSCDHDGDCADDEWCCSSGWCEPRQPGGTDCDHDSQCRSGNCHDGHCKGDPHGD